MHNGLTEPVALKQAKKPTHPTWPLKRGPRGDFEWWCWSVCKGGTPMPLPDTWVLLLEALEERKPTVTAKCSAYDSRCSDGGGHFTGGPGNWPRVRYKQGIIAADPRYHPAGEYVWFGAPINAVLRVMDTGGAIRGPRRYDVCLEGTRRHTCSAFGIKRIQTVRLGK